MFELLTLIYKKCHYQMLHVKKDLKELILVSGRGKERKLTLQGLTILLYNKTVGTAIY